MSDAAPWKATLSNDIECAIGLNQDCGGAEGVYALRDKVMAAVLPHMESAYKVGRMKATARIGRRYVTRNLELSRKLRLVRESVTQAEGVKETPFVRGWQACARPVLLILGSEDIASEAEADIRSRTLREAGWVPCSPEWLTAHPNQCGIALRVPGDADTSHWHPSSTRAGTLLEARKEIATWYVDDPAVQRTRDAMAYRLERKAAGDA